MATRFVAVRQQQRCLLHTGLDARHSARLACKASPSATVETARADTKAQPKRRLILLRHADSENDAKIRDHDRPISKEGLVQAASVATKLREMGWVPDVILASNAKRTRQTLEAMTTDFEELENADVHYLGSLYTAAALDGHTRPHLQVGVGSRALLLCQQLACCRPPPCATDRNTALIAPLFAPVRQPACCSGVGCAFGAHTACTPAACRKHPCKCGSSPAVSIYVSQERITELAEDDRHFTVLCIGHNKGWEEAASSFVKQEVRLKSATAALIQQASDRWQEALQDGAVWELVAVVAPA